MDNIIAFKIEREKREQILRIASSKGLSISAFCRLILFEQLKPEVVK